MSNIHKLPYTADEVEELLESAGSAITYSAQTLNKEQKAQARENIGSASQEDLYNISARYNSIEDALAAQNMISDGKIATHIVGDALNIILLEDIASSTTINITKDCTLHLNGKTLSFTTGAYLNINTADKVTINGEVEGSKIVKSGITSSASEKLVSATGTHLIITGGTYEMTSITAKTAIPIRTESATTKIDMDGCTVLSHGLGATKVKATQTDLLTARNCVFDASSVSEAVQALALFGDTQVYDSTINAVSTGGNAHGAVIADGKTLTIENCKITSRSDALGADVRGIGSNGNSVITNCHIEADGFSDTDTDDDGTADVVRVYAVTSSDNSNIIINGGYYWGARDALGILGSVRINGGTYEGCQHGGAYMESTDIMVKNATFRCVEYKGEVGWKGNSHGGAVYCGSSVNDVNVSFDHCRFESNCYAAHGIVAKYTNTEIFLSNCVIDGDFGNDLRADKTCTIYIGKNVAYETIGEPMPDNDTSYHGTIDTTTYIGQEFGFETIPTNYENLIDIKTGLLQEKLEQSILYTPQALTEEQKAQARENTNALSKSAITVDYAPPSNPEAQVWFNPNGAAGAALDKAESASISVARIVGLALNEMLNNTAARYATIQDALAGASATADGKVLAYNFGGKLNIMLLDDIASSSTIVINKDCTLHLNGKTLSFTASGAYLNITTASEVTINGNVAGSKIVKSGITSSASEKLVSATGTHLIITGGTYEMTGMTSKSAIPIRTEGATTKIDMDGCTVLSHGLGATRVKATQTDLLTARNCVFDASSVSEAVQALALFGDTQVYDSTINAVSTGGGNANGAIIADGKTLTIENCHIEVDGLGGDVVASAVSSHNADVIINGGYYYGTREAISPQGTSTIHINGGVFEGCQHGGGYFNSSTAKVKNATFRNIEYTGDCGWNRYHFGSVYCGSASRNDINVSFDNCLFESNVYTAHGITAKETNTELFLSNCVIDGNFKDDLRADKTCTIYIGKNVAYETIYIPTSPDAVEGSGIIDTTTYTGQEFGFETESVIPTALLSVKDERGNWIAIA